MSFLKISDPAKRDFIVSEYLKTKKNIQQNSLAEKLGDIGLQRELTKLYKPITESQSAQSAALTKELSALKETTSTALQALPQALSASLSSQLRAIQFPNYPSIQAETDDGTPKQSLIELGPIATKYLKSMASKTQTDKTFGLHDRDGNFYIGDSVVTLSGDDIIIGDETYTGSAGLWELITSKNPDGNIYTNEDLENYTNILLKTNAIINPETGKVRSSSGDKYKNIIKPIYEKHKKLREPSKYKKPRLSPSLTRVPATATLLPQTQSAQAHTGEGVSLMPSDPNALIEMLNLRVASYKAGNTGVRNEIVAIADELLRQSIIDKEYYKKLMLLL